MEQFVVESEYQNGKHGIGVLAPEGVRAGGREGGRHRVLYVLPVEAETAGNQVVALELLREMDAHNRYGLIIVQMGFEKEPWYGDHATERRVRQASYLKEFVAPLIESRYATLGGAEGRLLLGFSKSGWGAFSLLLREPGFWGYAAAWDAPLMFQDFHYGMREVYGTAEQLAGYRPDLLMMGARSRLGERPRLVLMGEKYWGTMRPGPGGGSHTVEAHQLLQREGIAHFYDDQVTVEHRWDKLWMEPTLKALMGLVRDPDGA